MKHTTKTLITFVFTLIYIYICSFLHRYILTWINSGSFIFSDHSTHLTQWRTTFFPVVCFISGIPIGFIFSHHFDLTNLSNRFRFSLFWIILALIPCLLQGSVYALPFSKWTGLLFNISVYFATLPTLNGILSGICIGLGLFLPPKE